MQLREYLQLQQQAKGLYKELQAVRAQIREMEAAMCKHCEDRNVGMVPIEIPDGGGAPTRGYLRVHDRTRKLPLSQADVITKLTDCLMQRFGKDNGIHDDDIRRFAHETAKSIWDGRRVKRSQGITVKLQVAG